MTKRWPDYWDLCLQCRYAGLDHVADFIHELYAERELLRDALRWALPYVKTDERVNAIVRAALKEGP